MFISRVLPMSLSLAPSLDRLAGWLARAAGRKKGIITGSVVRTYVGIQ